MKWVVDPQQLHKLYWDKKVYGRNRQIFWRRCCDHSQPNERVWHSCTDSFRIPKRAKNPLGR